MISTWSFYNTSTGLFTGRVFTGDEQQLSAITKPGTAALEGEFNAQGQRVDLNTMQVINYQAPSPGAHYVWDTLLRRWVESPTAKINRGKARQIREQIDTLQQQALDPMRELILDPTKTARRNKLTQIDADIAALRAQLLALG